MEKKVRQTLVNQRMMMGRKKLKSPETAGGNTPDTTANEDEEAWNHFCKKGTYALIYKNGRMSLDIRGEDGKNLKTHRIQVGQN